MDAQHASLHPGARSLTYPDITRLMWAIACVWLCADVALGLAGFFSVHQRIIGPIALAPVVVFAGAFAASPSLRSWAFAFDMKTLVTAQAVRMGGIAFLAVAAVGKLNGLWALWAGGIDCAIGLSALFAASYLVPATTSRQRRLLIAWMLIGLLDFVVAIPLARVIRAADPASMIPLSQPPLTVITTFFVPLALMDYFVLGAQLWRQRG